MPRQTALAIAVLAATTATAAPAAAQQVLPASIRLTDCSPDKASATFYARMRPVEEGTRMSVRLTLLERRSDAYETVEAGALSRWHRAKPGVGAFGFKQTVRGLRPGGLYRMQATFRWHTPEGETVERTRRRSAPCRQYDGTPDLAGTLVGAERTGMSGVLRYLVRVSNSGAAPAKEFELGLAVDGSVVNTVELAALAPGEERLVAIAGPECTTDVESLADPDGVIVESSETDNRHRVACADLPRS
jgi:hypothetical protein